MQKLEPGWYWANEPKDYRPKGATENIIVLIAEDGNQFIGGDYELSNRPHLHNFRRMNPQPTPPFVPGWYWCKLGRYPWVPKKFVDQRDANGLELGDRIEVPEKYNDA